MGKGGEGRGKRGEERGQEGGKEVEGEVRKMVSPHTSGYGTWILREIRH